MTANSVSLKKAAVINGASKYARIILATVFNAILARILSPYDFGIVAVITVFSTFFITLSDLGISPAIVQEKTLSKKEIDSLFTYSVYISLGLSLLFLLLAFPIAAFYRDSVYVKPTLLLSVALFFNAVNMVPNGLLNREKKFLTIGVRTVTVYLVSAPISIWLALQGWRFYALIAQNILAALLTFVWNWATARPRFLRHPEKTAILKIKNFASYQFAFNLVNYFARNLDRLLSGKFLGEAKLGNYNKAYNLMLFPINNLTGVISPVIHPILSDYQDRPTIIYDRYVRLVKILFSIGIAISAVSFLAADEIIGILYGDQWKECVTCFRYLSIAIIPQMINGSAGAIFQSLGKTKLLFRSSLVNTSITVAAILAGIFVGGDIRYLSICVAVSYIFHFFIAFLYLIKGGFNMRMASFFRELIPEILTTLVVFAAIMLYNVTLDNIILSLTAKTAYVGVIWLAMMFVTKEHRILFHK